MGLDEADRPLYEIKANLFKGLAHPYRIRILELLSAAEEVSVATMLAETDLEPSHLSQHLSVLRRHRLVSSQRRASHVYYRLTSARGAQLLAVARHLLAELLEDSAEHLHRAERLASAVPGEAHEPIASSR